MKIYSQHKVSTVFDASFLGIGYCYPYARTGIYRYVESLAKTLLMHRDCNLELYSASTVRHLVRSYYMRSHPEFMRTPFFHAGNALLDRLGQEIYRFSQSEIRMFSKIPAALVLLETLYSSSYAKQANRGDVFHSVFYPLPNHSEFSRGSVRFITIHDIGAIQKPGLFEFDKPYLQKAIMNSITPKDWIITLSQTVKDDLMERYKFRSDRIFVTTPGISDLFRPTQDPRQKTMVLKKYHIPNAPYIMSVGKLERHKNLPHLIKCFDRLVQSKQTPDLNLVLVGPDGWQQKEITQLLAKNPALQRRVFFTGFVQDYDLPVLMSQALTFVFPSLVEGFGFPPLEAMKCGIPVIASNQGSLPEIIGKAGLYVDPSDRDGLCHQIYQMYSNSTLRQEYSAKAIEHASHFTWENCAEQTLAAYRTGMHHRR